MEVDPSDFFEARNIEIEKLMILYDVIKTKVPLSLSPIEMREGKPVINIDVSDWIAGVLATTFTSLRKKKSGNLSEPARGYKARIGDVEVEIENIITDFEAKTIGPFDFKVATPIMNMLTAFKLAFDEVRLGVTKFRVRDETSRKRNSDGSLVSQEKPSMRTVMNYGLNNQHTSLCNGITFPPERRTGLLRCMGPMATAIFLCNETRFKDKLENALSESIKMLPMHKEITACVSQAKSPSDVSGLLGTLGDVLIMVLPRNQHKIFLPISFFEYMWRGTTAAHKNLISFSGVKMMAYVTTRLKSVRFQMRTMSDTTRLSQAIFHAMFGTYCSEISSLSQITNVNQWYTRKELADTFKDRSKAPSKMFNPIYMTYYSKMSSASRTKLLGTMDPMMTGSHPFSGKTVRNTSDALKMYLQSGKAHSSYGSDVGSLTFALKNLKDELLKEFGNDKYREIGTTSWYCAEEDVLKECDFILREGNQYFYV